VAGGPVARIPVRHGAEIFAEFALSGACFRMRTTDSSRCRNLSRGVALRAGQQVFGDDLPRGVFAAAAAAADGQLALHIEKRAGAMIDRFADLTIADCMADAYVHVGPLEAKAAGRLSNGADSKR
jgi:hypothetical protein